MDTDALRMPVATATRTKTSLKTYLAVATIGGASFAAAMFMAASQNALLALTLSPNAVDVQAAEGDNDVVTLNMAVAAKNKAVTITNLTFDVIGDTDGDFSSIQNDLNVNNYLSDCQLIRAIDGSVQSGVSQVIGGQLTFPGLAINIPKGEGGELQVRCDLSNPLTAHANPYAIAVSLPTDTQVSAEEYATGTALPAGQIIVGRNDLGVNVQPQQELYIDEFASTLTLSRAATPGDVTAVDGEDNVAVLGIETSVAGSQNVIVDSLTVSVYGDGDGNGTATLGGDLTSDVNDYIESCSLFDNTTAVGTPRPPEVSGQTIIFPNLSWVVGAQSTKSLTLKCNFANTPTRGDAYFAFDVNEADTDVIAADENGSALLAGQLNGSMINSGGVLANAYNVTLRDNGWLSAVTGPSTPAADILLTGSTDNHVSTVRFTSAWESFVIDKISFSEEQAEDDFNRTDVADYSNNIGLVTIEYKNSQGTIVQQSGVMNGNEVKFSNVDVFVQEDVPSDVKVYVDVPATERNAGGSATSNEKIRLGFFVDTANADNFHATAAITGYTLIDGMDGIQSAVGDDDFDGIHTFVIKETKPTITLSAASPSGYASVGREEALRFNVAANAQEDVVLSQLVFKISSTDNNGDDVVDWNDCDSDDPAMAVDPSDFDFYNLTDDGTAVTLDLSSSDVHNTTVAQMSAGTNNPWTLLKTNGAICDATNTQIGFARLRLPTPEIIPSGETKTFSLHFDSTGASSGDDDSLRFDLVTDPIASSYLYMADALNELDTASLDTTLSVDDGTAFAVGDIIVVDVNDNGGTAPDRGEEHMLVTNTSPTELTVVRGYLGSKIEAADIDSDIEDYDSTDGIFRLPGSLLWKDDGIAGQAGSADDFWGTYLVDSLPVSGGTLIF